MKISLKRRWFNEKATIGEMFLNDDVYRFCYTLEDVVRDVKIPGETAIPDGRYEVILSESKRFKKIMPRLLGVPGFDGILIHPGNTEKDTHGCILVGCQIINTSTIGQSSMAFSDLMLQLQYHNPDGETFIDITNEGVKT